MSYMDTTATAIDILERSDANCHCLCTCCRPDPDEYPWRDSDPWYQGPHLLEDTTTDLSFDVVT